MMLAGCSGEMPSSSTPAANVEDPLLARYCGGCHGLPKPQSYPAAAWPGIVWRMQGHRSQRAMPMLTDEELKEVTDYLIRHAKPN